jgi:hypothetical protein
MPHDTEIIVKNSILDPWTDPATHPGVREHFTDAQIARILAIASNPSHLTFGDKVFVVWMLAKLVFTAV